MKTKGIPFNATTPEAAQYRADQAMIDADIEGMARDPELESLIEAWEAEGLPNNEIKARISAYFTADEPVTQAAE